MDFFKKKPKISGNYITNQEIDVQSVPESDMYSNIYSELEDTDKANIELLGSLLKKYKNTKVVENLNIDQLEQDLTDQQIKQLDNSQNLKITESTFQNQKSNLTFQQQERLFKQKVKVYDYQDNKELVITFLKENKKRARQYLENRLLDKELRKNIKFLLKKKEQILEEKKNINQTDKEKYSIENLEKAIENMKLNLDRVSGKNSMKKFLKKVDDKTDIFIDKNKAMEKKVDLILKDFEQIRENLLEIIVELNQFNIVINLLFCNSEKLQFLKLIQSKSSSSELSLSSRLFYFAAFFKLLNAELNFKIPFTFQFFLSLFVNSTLQSSSLSSYFQIQFFFLFKLS